MLLYIVLTMAGAVLLTKVEANLDYFRPQEFDIAQDYWGILDRDNSSYGCYNCGGHVFHSSPPPDDIMFLPPPPMHPSFHSSFADMINSVSKQTSEQCIHCNLFTNEGEQPQIADGSNLGINGRFIALLAFLSISGLIFIYLLTVRRTKIIASLTRSRLFMSNQQANTAHHQLDKNRSLNESIANSGVHLSDPCYLQTNQDKNLTSPIISEHVSHKKTSIPSKYWAQPGSIIGRTIRRIPNEYEIPSSRTNSTGTSSAVYGDMIQDNNQRFFSPYNLHTYAEVREVLDPNEHFHTSSNSSVMLSESNYDNAVYSHGSCVVGNGAMVAGAPNGSVQMSDFNPMRPMQSIPYSQANSITHHQLNHTAKLHHNNGQPIYEQPPQRAQIIITSNNQGVNPSLLNYKERIHNVI